MPLLLHLSDLHLAEGEVAVGDYNKGATVPAASQQSRLSVMEASLRELADALRAADESLDSVVITGDVTSLGAVDGFKGLSDLLAHLGDVLPDSSQIVVVPGNHDVDWNHPPSDPKRYAGFESLRAANYRTPYLEGVDLDANGKDRAGALARPITISPDGRYVVVAMNSSNYCGLPGDTLRAIDDELARKNLPASAKAALERVRDVAKHSSTYDMARIDAAQFKALSRELNSAKIPPSAVRILALHHQVAPPTTVEELKPFEAIINLGELSDWLIANRIDVVLHGHKHAGRSSVQTFTQVQGSPVERRVAVFSAPSIQVGQVHDFGRLIRIGEQVSRVPVIDSMPIPARTSQAKYALDAWVATDLDDRPLSGVFSGTDITEVHDQLLAFRDRLESLPGPIICRVSDGPSCLELPVNYPDIAGLDASNWFQVAVEWWQRPDRGKAAAFNHGERLHNPTVADRSQFEHVVRVLRESGAKDTSRAVAILVNPSRDFIGTDPEYPSFLSVQFVKRNKQLDVIATFRKQEMAHWWPINMGELASLQQKVLEDLGVEGTDISPGSIATVTAMPRDGEGIPRVAVPWIDRLLDRPADMLVMVAPLMSSAPAADVANRCREEWEKLFSDWVPSSAVPADGDPAPVLGLRELARMLVVGEGAIDGAKLVSLSNHLRELAGINEVYLSKRKESGAAKRRIEWVSEVEEVTSRLRADLESLLDGAPKTT